MNPCALLLRNKVHFRGHAYGSFHKAAITLCLTFLMTKFKLILFWTVAAVLCKPKIVCTIF